MGKNIRCPKCSNTGAATTDETGAFEVRGHFEGKPVRRCRACGAGVFLGWLGGAKLIPPDLWKRMEESWQKEFGSRDILKSRFWNLTAEVKAKAIHKQFIERCVHKVARDMTTAVLQNVSRAQRVFRERQKYLQGEMGAAIIEGYIAARLIGDGLSAGHPISQFATEQHAALFARVEECWANSEIGDIRAELQELLEELVDIRLQTDGFRDLEDQSAAGKYLYMLLLNGVQWAAAEDEVLR